jgi:transcriptional regulator with XRE-family HTH domain
VVTLVNMNNKLLAQRLTEAMSDARLSPNALARKVGVSQVAVHKWMTGTTKRLRHEVCLKAAAALYVNPDWLNDGIGPRAGQKMQDVDDLQTIQDAIVGMEEGLRVLRLVMKRQVESRGLDPTTLTIADAARVIRKGLRKKT